MVWIALGVLLNVMGAFIAGVHFGRILRWLNGETKDGFDLPWTFSTALLAFAIPFYSPMTPNFAASVSFFIALTAVITFFVAKRPNF